MNKCAIKQKMWLLFFYCGQWFCSFWGWNYRSLQQRLFFIILQLQSCSRKQRCSVLPWHYTVVLRMVLRPLSQCTWLSCHVSLYQRTEIYWQSHSFLLVKLVKTDIYPAIKILSTADLTNVASGAMSACRGKPVYLERCNSTAIMRNYPRWTSHGLWERKEPIFISTIFHF